MSNHMMVTVLSELEEQAKGALVSGNMEALGTLLNAQRPADAADIINRLRGDDQIRAYKLLSPQQAAEVLHEVGAETTRHILHHLTPQEIADVLNRMPMDEAAEIVTDDVPDRQDELLALMQAENAALVRDLLQYPRKGAGRLMTEKFVRATPDMTAKKTLQLLRNLDAQVETLTDIYVVDSEVKLVGVLSLRELVTAPPNQKLAQLMTTQVVSVGPEEDREEVARLLSRYDFLAIPVVADGKLLGIITVDDLIDVLVEEDTEDALRFGGIEGGGTIDQPYFTVPLFQVIRKRVGWLLLLFLAETLTGSVLRIFEAELDTVVALSFFIPLLIGTGGNTGAQTVSTIIRGLALHEIRLKDSWKVLVRELGTGLLMGLLLGAVAFGRAQLWGTGVALAGVVALTIVAICTWANTIGSLVPLIAQRFKIDPAVVSAPLITTLVDATGLAIYMLIAKALLGL